MALTTQQIAQCVQDFTSDVFVTPNALATLSVADIQNAINAIDTAMNATLNQAVTAQGGTTVVKTALLNQVRAAVPSITVPQAAFILIYWAKRAAGL